MQINKIESPVVVFYNVFSRGNTQNAVEIVNEQLSQLRTSPLWAFVMEIRYSTIGPESIGNAVMKRCGSGSMKCTHLGHFNSSDEGSTLTHIPAFCAAHPDASVAYIHDKGSLHDNPSNRLFRKVLLRGLSSWPCVNAIAGGGPPACNVCSMRFSPFPHQHPPGNMWLARCGYLAKLHEPHHFQARMHSLYPNLHNNPRVGTGRYAYEHWVHSHPSLRPCDVLQSPYAYGYKHLPRADYNFSFALAPRRSGRLPDEKFITRLRNEWLSLYNATPPDDSRLAGFYRFAP